MGDGSRKSSKFKGVTLFRPTGKWRAQISAHGKTTSLGDYVREEQAAAAYDLAALIRGGQLKIATTNFPYDNYRLQLKQLKDLSFPEVVAVLRRGAKQPPSHPPGARASSKQQPKSIKATANSASSCTTINHASHGGSVPFMSDASACGPERLAHVPQLAPGMATDHARLMTSCVPTAEGAAKLDPDRHSQSTSASNGQAVNAASQTAVHRVHTQTAAPALEQKGGANPMLPLHLFQHANPQSSAAQQQDIGLQTTGEGARVSITTIDSKPVPPQLQLQLSCHIISAAQPTSSVQAPRDAKTRSATKTVPLRSQRLKRQSRKAQANVLGGVLSMWSTDLKKGVQPDTDMQAAKEAAPVGGNVCDTIVPGMSQIYVNWETPEGTILQVPVPHRSHRRKAVAPVRAVCW